LRRSYKDWYWKARVGRCEYQLGMLEDAAKQFKSALKLQARLALRPCFLKPEHPLGGFIQR